MYLQFFYVFFLYGSGSKFSGLDPDLWSIRIRTQKKKFYPDPEKKSGSETLVFLFDLNKRNEQIHYVNIQFKFLLEQYRYQ